MAILHSVELPNNALVTRQLRKAIPPSLQEGFDSGQLGAYDQHTIFYDLFLNPHAQEVIAIGPPLLNLEQELLPAQVWINDEPSTLQTAVNHKKLAVYTIPVKQVSDPLMIRLAFRNGLTYEALLDSPLRFAPRGRALVAIQKNNEIEWIKDWISYYQTVWSIDYVCLYDNGSDNQQELAETLGSDKIAVIPWNFPFGMYLMETNNYCQIGALNHFRYRFGQRCKIFNFDIDELLVGKDPKLQQRIERKKLIRFDSYNVPHDPNVQAPYSFDDFTTRNRLPRHGAYKYIIDGRSTDVLQHHRTFPRRQIIELLRKALPKKHRHGRIESVDKAYFMHFMAITTNWKKGDNKPKVREEQAATAAAAEQVSDLSVKHAFDRIRTQ